MPSMWGVWWRLNAQGQATGGCGVPAAVGYGSDKDRDEVRNHAEGCDCAAACLLSATGGGYACRLSSVGDGAV